MSSFTVSQTKTTGVGFGATTATPTFGSPAQVAPNTGLTFGTSLGQSSLTFGTPQQQQQQQSSGISFGTPTNIQPTALGFGTPSAAPTSTQTGLSFGTPTSAPQTALSFGTPATSAPPFGTQMSSFGQTGLNFGATTATTQPQTVGYSFGAPGAAATTAFGTPGAAATTAFGAPGVAAATAFGTPGAAATSAFGVPGAAATTAFGAPSAAATTAFGVPVAAVAATPAFGAPAAAATSAFGAPAAAATATFGAPATSTFGTPASSTAFGAPVTSTAFGAAATSTAFGAPATSTTFGAPATSSAFGSPATSTAFGASATQTFGALPAATATTPATTTAFGVTGTPQFGGAATLFALPTTTTTTAATTAAPTLGFGLNVGTPTTTTSTAPLSFGQGTIATTKPFSLFSSTPATTAGIGFGATQITTPSSGFNLGTSGGILGLGGKSFGSLGSSTAVTTTTTTTTTSFGLGGLDPSQNKLGLAGTGSARTDNKAVKENQVPNEIVQTVDSFKAFLKMQQNLSSDVARGSAKPLNKVQEETENLKQTLASLQNGIQRSSALVVKLKSDTAKCLQNAEMAQRTHDTPPGLQYDNTAPLKYFQDLVANFEHEMKVFKLEINNTEKHLHSLMQPMPLTSQELSLAMRRLHDSFVALAGRLQSVHNSVETEKNQYLLLRKYFLKDSSNVFEEEAKKSVLASSKTKSSSKASAGPTPFSALGGQHGFGLLSSSSTLSKPSLSSGWSGGQTPQQQLQPQQPQAASQFQQSQFSTPTLSNTLFSGANTSSLTSPQPVENQNFQLQKPPLGNKRGKR